MGCEVGFAIVGDDVDSSVSVGGILDTIDCNVGCFGNEVGKSAIEVGGDADSGKLVSESVGMMGCNLGVFDNDDENNIGELVGGVRDMMGCKWNRCTCRRPCLIEMVNLMYSLKMMAIYFRQPIICSKARD